MATPRGGKPQPRSATPAPAPVSTPPKPAKPVTVPWIRARGEKIAAGKADPLVMVTAYDYPQGRSVDAAGADMVLVGDSLAMVVLGHPDTLSLSVDEMLHHVKAARRGVDRALLVADMPYGSFHLGPRDAVRNALRLVKEGGAQAVKIEGARPDIVEALVGAEIPVMAHLGLTPQSLHRFGGFKVQGRGGDAAAALLDAADAMVESGAFSLVLECVPADLATEVSRRIPIPTIGIGAGAGCDGQVLVLHDLLGLEDRIAPRFVRRYAELGTDAREAIGRFAADVRARRFPSVDESYADPSRRLDTAAGDDVGRLYG
ncbi:MAG: 3-methyl-2-oxobutanoate hydroxymethyltransferase [Acidobacteriota bacterium]